MSRGPTSSIHWLEHLKYFRDLCEQLEQLLQDISYNDFRQNKALYLEAHHTFVIMGNIVPNLPQGIIDEKLMKALREIKGTRNYLMHEYFGNSRKVLYEDATAIIPNIRAQIQAICDEHLKNYETEQRLLTIATTRPRHATDETNLHPLIPITTPDNPDTASVPTLFPHGRAAELNMIAQSINGKITPTMFIAATPKTGTTTLLHNAAQYAQRIGCAVVQLTPIELRNSAIVLEKCHAAVAAINEPISATQPSNANPESDATLTAHAQHMSHELSQRIQTMKQQKPLEHYHNYIQFTQDLTTISHYGAKHQNIVIICDDLHHALDFNPADQNLLKEHLELLTQIANRKTAPLALTMILAGHPTTIPWLESLITQHGKIAAKVIQLTPVIPEYGCRILRDHLTSFPECPQVATFYDPEQIDLLGNSCHGHVHFAAQLGPIMRHHAIRCIHNGRTQATPIDHDQMRQALESIKTTTYRQHCPPTKDIQQEPLQFLLHHIAAICSRDHTAYEEYPNAPPQPPTIETVYTLAKYMLMQQKPQENTIQNTQSQQKLIRTLQQNHTLQITSADKTFLLLDRTQNLHDRVVINPPGMVEYLASESIKLTKNDRAIIRDNIEAARNQLGPQRMTTNTRWHWHNVTPRTPVPSVTSRHDEPPIQYEKLPEKYPPRQESSTGLIEPDPNPQQKLPEISQTPQNKRGLKV